MSAALRLVLMFCLAASCTTAQAADANNPPEAHGFTLPDLNAGDYTFEPAAGKLTYLDFWASWCGPCKISFPDMIALQAEFGPARLSIITVSVDEKPSAAKKFLRRFDTNFITLIDTRGEIAEKYQLPAMPTSFLIDGNGNIREIHSGYRPGDIEHLRSSIKALLNE